ncbi:MAG: HK97 family phage prohead protease [Planctomycetota bacterium]|jgi:hypothetical protein
MMNDRHELNAFLKETGLALSGDLVYLEPARSRTMEVRRSEKAVVATISTAARDRHGDVIDPRGVRLERFRKNPVVLYAHDYEGLPVARSLWERVRDGDAGPELVAKPQFHMDTELSREVWALVEKGVLSAWSVGFVPEEWEPLDGGDMNRRGRGVRRERRTAAEGERPPRDDVGKVRPFSASSAPSAVGKAVGFRVRKWDLLEYSSVPVAANFEALTRELKARKITAPALVKSLAPLGMREPDLVPQPVTAGFTAEGAAGAEDGHVKVECRHAAPSSRVRPLSACSASSAVRDAVARGFDRWLERARGGSR